MFFNLQNRPKLQPSKFRLSTYNETNVLVKDCCILRITHVFTSIPVLFHVVDNDSPLMLGLLTSNNLDLIRRIMEINRCVPDYLQQYIMMLISRGGFRAAETSKMECFVMIVSGWKPSIIITKNSILDVAAALDPPLMRGRCCVYICITTLLFNWLSFISLLCQIALWFAKHVVYLMWCVAWFHTICTIQKNVENTH